jgi:transposase-like protein
MAVTFLAKYYRWKCNGCKKQFTVKVGTLMEDSPLPLKKWMVAVWLITNAKNGVSSCEVGRAIGVCQKTAWFVLHRVRCAMEEQFDEKIPGPVEADETFIGGKEKNKHGDKKLRRGRGSVGKEVVMGILERATETDHSTMRAKVVADTTKDTLHTEIRANVEPGAEVFTDAHKGYRGLSDDYRHAWVDHAVKYVEGAIHTNGCENFWSLFKRMLHGTYTHIDPRHLQSYIDEETSRFNNRKLEDGERFHETMRGMDHKRLMYKQLTERGLRFIDGGSESA